MIVHIGIGSNLGERVANCLKAIDLLREKGLIIKKLSSFYETKPWGFAEQPYFINAAIEAETSLLPDELLAVLKNIEKGMGRIDNIQWGPRIIDLDILFYGDEVVETESLNIPHPLLQERAFVLIPLEEICPDKIHPIIKKTVRQLKEDLGHDKYIKRKEQK